MEYNKPLYSEPAKPKSKWYDNEFYVVALLLFLFPVGIYGLIRSSSFQIGGKLVLGFFFSLIFGNIISHNFPDEPKVDETKKSSATPVETIIEVETPEEREARMARAREDLLREERELKAYHKTKAGEINKKHPEWSREDCERLADRQIWVGMSYSMLRYQRGLPNSANPSNYGKGNQWQWCWHDYTPSCFYDHNDDGIIDAYN